MSYIRSVQSAIDYIEEHLAKELHLSVIADEAYLSVAQLYRAFYALTGHPVKDYIRKRRISIAADHLRTSKRTVEDLAWDSGFKSYYSFAKVFKKIVGLTPAAYREAGIIFSFESVRLDVQLDYDDQPGRPEHYAAEVKVIRFAPDRMYSYLHVSNYEEGMENEAYRTVIDLIDAQETVRNVMSKLRIFGCNVDLPQENGASRYGYRIWVSGVKECTVEGLFAEEPFEGGMYAVRTVAATSPHTIQDGWNRLLAEWLPKSTFEIGTHSCIEEFMTTSNGKLARMNLYLPLRRKLHNEPIEFVQLTNAIAYFCRGSGREAQRNAERKLIDWYERGMKGNWQAGRGKYYISYSFDKEDSEGYWWENGIVRTGPDVAALEGLEAKTLGSGRYACCTSKTYGLLTGVLDNLHRWIKRSVRYRLDQERQWFAEYHTPGEWYVEKDTFVKVYIPIRLRESERDELFGKKSVRRTGLSGQLQTGTGTGGIESPAPTILKRGVE